MLLVADVERDHEPHADAVSLALTRPSMKWGVRFEVFTLNGMLGMFAFLGTSSFIMGGVTFGIAHLISLYLCQRDAFFFHILECRASMRSAVGNLSFWGARSYSP